MGPQADIPHVPACFPLFLLCKELSSTGQGWKVTSGFPPVDFSRDHKSCPFGRLRHPLELLLIPQVLQAGWAPHTSTAPSLQQTWVSMQKKGLARKGNGLAYGPARTVHTDGFCGPAEL